MPMFLLKTNYPTTCKHIKDLIETGLGSEVNSVAYLVGMADNEHDQVELTEELAQLESAKFTVTYHK